MQHRADGTGAKNVFFSPSAADEIDILDGEQRALTVKGNKIYKEPIKNNFRRARHQKRQSTKAPRRADFLCICMEMVLLLRARPKLSLEGIFRACTIERERKTRNYFYECWWCLVFLK
jgi:hypothetical protein